MIKRILALALFLFQAFNGYTYDIRYQLDEYGLNIFLDNITNDEVRAAQALNEGDTNRLVIQVDLYDQHWVFQEKKERVIVERYLRFSRLDKAYVLQDKSSRSLLYNNFHQAFADFTHWNIQVNSQQIDRITIKIAYANYYYRFPFSIFYFMPGSQEIQQKTIYLKKN